MKSTSICMTLILISIIGFSQVRRLDKDKVPGQIRVNDKSTAAEPIRLKLVQDWAKKYPGAVGYNQLNTMEDVQGLSALHLENNTDILSETTLGILHEFIGVYILDFGYYFPAERTQEFNDAFMLKLKLNSYSKLRDLTLPGQFLTDLSAKQIGQCHNLQKLFIPNCPLFSDDGVLSWVNLTNLEFLNMEHSQITDQSLAAIRTFSKLRLLNLAYSNNLTDDGLKQLYGLTKLEQLWIYQDAGKGKITQAGINALRAALPNCTIH